MGCCLSPRDKSSYEEPIQSKQASEIQGQSEQASEIQGQSEQVSEIQGSSNTSETALLIFEAINRKLGDERSWFAEYKRFEEQEREQKREQQKRAALAQERLKEKVKNYEFRHTKSDIINAQVNNEEIMNRSMDNSKVEGVPIAQLLNYKYDEMIMFTISKKDLSETQIGISNQNSLEDHEGNNNNNDNNNNNHNNDNNDNDNDNNDNNDNQSIDQCSFITDQLDEVIYSCYHCNMEIQSEMIQLNCQHCYERQCIINIIINQISDGQLIIHCKCGQKIPQFLLKELLPETEIEKLFQLQLEQLQQQI